MVEKIATQKDFTDFIDERQQVAKLRNAISFCKDLLEINVINDRKLQYEERVNFEKCLTENFLVKHGYDYFGKRDLIYIDLYGKNDVAKLRALQ